MENWADKIEELKKRKNAVILAHYYTLPEVQEVADFVGDSLALSQKAAATTADIILFAGVHFMAETAKILNPDKKVLIPDLSAGCSLADCCAADDLENFLKDYPRHLVISYINCSAKVKALSDIIVTSGNALKIVNELPEDEKIVFAPDRNLGGYVNAQTGRKMVLWDGACHIHNAFSVPQVAEAKQLYPNALVLAHPECTAAVLACADFVGSTAAMLKYVSHSPAEEFIVVTEPGILHELNKQNPTKCFYSLNPLLNGASLTCNYMKTNTLKNMFCALDSESPELILDESLMDAARRPILKMLEMSAK